MAQGHVFVIGNEVDHLIQRDQLDTLACSRADVATWAAATFGGGACQRSELDTVGTLGFL
ncbi:hypothetical protein D3C78_1928980 [compost metagenome]